MLRIRPGHPYLAGAPLFMAHRGGSRLAPENTLDAFDAAVSRWRSDVLELDVRATRDGKVVVLHDATVDRTTNGSGAIAQMDWAEVQSLDAGYRFVDLDGDPVFRERGVRIPLFEDVLIAFPDMRLNVEIKSADAALGLIEIIDRHSAHGRVLVAAEVESARSAVRDYTGPWGASGEQLRRLWVTLRVPGLSRVYTPRADAYQIPYSWRGQRVVTPELVAAAHARNVAVHVWTVDSADRMHELLDLGVDGIQTDRPDVMDAVFKERGLR